MQYGFTGTGDGSITGNTCGSFTPTPAFAGTTGARVQSVGGDDSGASGAEFYVCLYGTLPKNYFAAVQLGAPANVTLNSASAASFSTSIIPGYTYWGWSGNPLLPYNGDNIGVTFFGIIVAGQGDITDPGAWEDNAGNIPPLAYQNVPQNVSYPLNGDGRYWFTASAYSPNPSPIAFIGNPSFLVNNASFQYSITQQANDGSELWLAYSTNGGATYVTQQIGPSAQASGLVSGQIVAGIGGVLTMKVYATGGSSSSTATPWNVAVAITRNVNEQIAWDYSNPFNPVSYNCECADNGGVPTDTLIDLRTRLINRLGFKTVLAETTGQTLTQLQAYVLQRIGFSTQSANPPPGMANFLTACINEAQQTLYRRYAQDTYGDAAPSILVNGTDTISLNNIAVQLQAVAIAKAHYGQPDAKAIQQQVETYMAELFKRSPPNLVPILNDFLLNAQTYLYRRYTQLHTRRLFRWKVSPGQRFYSLKDNDEDVLCNFQMDPLKQIEWAGIQDTRNVWYPLIEGIPPQLYTMIDKPWRPARYEIRQCIELYPSPDQTYWLWIKAHFGLASFVNDSDSTTIDSELVFMHALANAKAHYGQKDADNIEAQANAYRKELIAGSHGTKKYVPGTIAVPPAVRPTLIQFDNGNGSSN